MHCEFCGKEIGEAAFCRYCGKKVTPPPKIEPWKQSIPFTILGIVISTALIVFFQTRGFDGWLWCALYVMCAFLWLLQLPDKLEEDKNRREQAIKERKEYHPDTRFISFVNCLFAWLFGIVLNRALTRGELGKMPRTVLGIVVGGWVLTGVVGFSLGFLYVIPESHFMIRSTTQMVTDTNDQGWSVYTFDKSEVGVILFAPSHGSIDSIDLDDGEWYQETFDLTLADGMRLPSYRMNDNRAVMQAYVDDNNRYRICVVFVQGNHGDCFEVRFFFPEDSDRTLSQCREVIYVFFESFTVL